MPRAQFRNPAIRPLICTLLCFLCVFPAAGAQEVPRELSDLHLPIGKVIRTDFSPDGAFLVYQAYFEYRDHLSVYSLPVAGGVGDEILLGQRWGTFGSPIGYLGFSRDSSRVLFVTPDRRLVSVPITGGEQTTLYAAGPDGFFFDIELTVDGQVVFSVQPPNDAQPNVFVVPLTGGSALQLSQLPGSGWSAGGVEVSEDGTRVVYAAAISLAVELYSVAIAGGTPMKISHQLQAGQSIDTFKFSPDGVTLAYEVGTPVTPNFYVNDLYSVPAAGGPSVLLHDGWDGSHSEFHGTLGVSTFFFSADSSQILFPDSTFSQTELSVIASAGGTKTLIDTQPWIGGYWWFPEVSRLFYQWSVPNYSVGTLGLGAGPGVQLSVHPQGNLGARVQISPDLSRVAYTAHVLTGQRLDIYSVPTAGGAPTLLNDPQASQEDVFDLAMTDSEVIFGRDRRLVSVPIDGGPETFLTDSALSLLNNRMSPYPDGADLAYRASFESVDVVELFKVAVTGGPSEILNPPITEVQGEVLDHVVGAAGQFAAYRADQDKRGKYQLYETRIDGAEGGGTRLMNPPLADSEDVFGPILAAATATVIYKVSRFGTFDELWATPFGGLPRLLFELETVTQYQVVEPGNKLLYLDDGELLELDLISGLTRDLEDFSSFILGFSLSSDQTMIILRTSNDFLSLPISGGTPVPLGAHGTLLGVSPDNNWILVDEILDDVVLVATDGSEERDIGNVSFKEAFTADGQYVFYKLIGSDELWSYSITEDLHRRLDVGAGPEEYFLSDWRPLEGDEVLFALTNSSSFVRRLFRVSAGGGAPASILDAAIDDREIADFYLSPDLERLVLKVADELVGPSVLHMAATSGGPSAPLADSSGARFVAFSPDSQIVFYQEDGSNFEAPLLAAPVTGSAPIRLTPEGFGEVEGDLSFGPGDLLTLRFARHKERTDLHVLDLGDFFLFSDGFESGNLSAWSFSLP